jgi:WD40 repeat protein/DNA-binding SARP family transcriptional activator
MSLTLQIKLFGEFSLTYGDRSVSGISSGRSQALLAYLVLNRHSPQLRQRLAFQLWADSTDTQARTNLRKELSHLRHTLPAAENYLLVDAKTIQWQPTAAVVLDVAEFEKAVKTAEQSADLALVRSRLEQALSLYRGDLLPNCEDEWVLPERERLGQLRVSAYERLIDLLRQQQDYRTALGYAQQLLRVDTLNEATYCTLMRLYALSGDRANALQTYHRCMTMLREELGIDPSAATQTLYQQILSEDEQSLYAEPKSAVPAPAMTYQDECAANISWSEAPDAFMFYGRDTELRTLEHWIVDDRCRLVLLLGMGGIGKTALAVKLAQQVQDRFECVIWRSLRDAPPLKTLLADLVSFLSQQQETEAGIGRLVHWLRARRALVILDNAETLFEAGDRAGQYCPDYAAYGELIQAVGERPHQSCLLLTSREKPAEVAAQEGEAVRTFELSGSAETAKALLSVKGAVGSEAHKQQLIEQYGGNPLALMIIASSIQAVFDGDIEQFLQQDAILFSEIRHLLEQQFERLSSLEQTILYWLAINREWTTIAQLEADIFPTVTRTDLLEALKSLRWRSLIEQRSGSYTQQPVVMEYVCDRLVEQAGAELITQKLSFFGRYALIKTTVRDYIRESQIRLVLQPIAHKLQATFRSVDSMRSQLQAILAQLRANPSLQSSYGAGNLLNLCCHLQLDLADYDFSELTIQHACLEKAKLHQVNFANSTFTKSTFTKTLSAILAVAFSPDGTLLVTGEGSGQVHLWRIADSQLLFTLEGHTNWALTVAFSPDGSILATGSHDQTVKLWNVQTGRLLNTCTGHTSLVWSVAFSPDGRLLASGSGDRTIKLWNTHTGQILKTLQEHTDQVQSVKFNPEGTLLASGSVDHTIKLWNVQTGEVLHTLEGHTSSVLSVDFSPDGQRLASGSADQLAKLWNVRTGKQLRNLEGHSNCIWSIAFSPDGKLLATGSQDQTVKLWDLAAVEPETLKPQLLKTLQGHTNWIWSIAFSPDGKTLASSGFDHTVKLWDVRERQLIKTVQGCTNWVWSVAFSPDGNTLASGNFDHTVRFWDVGSIGRDLTKSQGSQLIKTLQGHTAWVLSVAFNADGMLLASGGSNQIRLWNVRTGAALKTLQGHVCSVLTTTFSPDGKLVASGSQDHTIKLWDVETGQLVKTLQGHTDWVWSIAFSPNGEMLASGSDDHTIKLWNVTTGEAFSTLSGHTSSVFSVQYSPNGNLLASSSDDHTIKLWNVSTQELLSTLGGSSKLGVVSGF